MSGQEIDKPALFARLAAGPSAGQAAGVTVVTPNRRLAQVLKAEFDAFQARKGLPAWEDADILPLEAFVARCYEDARYAEGGGALPELLTGAQARALWEEAIRGSRWNGALLDVPQTAASAQEAWRLARQWRLADRLEGAAGSEDARAFAEWAKACARRLKKEGFVDAASLADLDFPIRKPALLVAYAFDIVPGQAGEFLGRFTLSHCPPEKRQGRSVKASYATPREELEAAARWARARLEAGKARIGVVVPDLHLRRREVARVFARTMGDGGAAGAVGPFELSIGEPLADHPLAACALALLEFSFQALPFETASRLLRSPFLGGAEGEAAARARLDAKLRREAGTEISLPKLIGMVGEGSSLRLLLEAVYAKSKEGEGRIVAPHDWARHFTALLDAAGFPGERTLDTAEYQARARFNELLGEFARLSLLSLKLNPQAALRNLRRLCKETLFQPEGAGGAGAPVQVLGLLESAGLAFDALWVSGLTDGQWPQRVRPHPFVPVALQREAGIPEASAEASLALDARRTEGWLAAADEAVFSWARREEDRELSPSPLIAGVPEGVVDLPVFASYRASIFESAVTESYTDEKADPVASTAIRGGTRVLADQAACPFRAFARHRLAAEALDAPEPGLDAMQRGQLLHTLMAGIWVELRSSAALSSDLKKLIEKSAANAVQELSIEEPFAALEKQRLIRLAGEWLEVERERPAFEVVHVEQKRPLDIGGLSFSGRIDRMDRLADGTHAIIDYKTGRATRSAWLGERPDEPQLPLYVVSADEDVTAVAFATLRPGEMKFSGYGLEGGSAGKSIPGVQAAKSWSGLVATWKRDLEKLAADYVAGDARVDPKKALATCRQCDLQPLCRVHEKLGALDEEEGGE
jgi:probable DNA repair protein